MQAIVTIAIWRFEKYAPRGTGGGSSDARPEKRFAGRGRGARGVSGAIHSRQRATASASTAATQWTR